MYRMIALIFGAVVSLAASELHTTANVSFPGVNALQNGNADATIPAGIQYQNNFFLLTAGADAHSGYLTKGTAAFASSLDLLPLRIFSGPEAYALAGSFDVITSSVSAPFSSGFLVLDFLVSGSNFGLLSGDPSAGNSVGTSRSTSYSSLTVCLLDPGTPGFTTACNDASETFTSIDYLNVPIEVRLPVVFGRPIGLNIFQVSDTNAQFDPDLAVSFDGYSNFVHTSTLTSVKLLDDSGNPLANPTLLAESGTIYPLNGGGGAAVPEPSSVTLLMAGALAMYVLGRRRVTR